MGGRSNIYEFKIHSNSLIHFIKKCKKCSIGPFLSTVSDVSFSFFSVFKSRMLTVASVEF